MKRTLLTEWQPSKRQKPHREPWMGTPQDFAEAVNAKLGRIPYILWTIWYPDQKYGAVKDPAPGEIIKALMQSSNCYICGHTPQSHTVQIYALTSPSLVPTACYGASTWTTETNATWQTPAPFKHINVQRLQQKTLGYDDWIKVQPYRVQPNWTAIVLYHANPTPFSTNPTTLIWIGSATEHRAKVQLYHLCTYLTASSIAARIVHWTCALETVNTTAARVSCILHDDVNDQWSAGMHMECVTTEYILALTAK